MDRSNHYEVAFESYLQMQRLGYVAVDETRRAQLEDAPVKSPDFLVFGKDGARLVVDIKGRRFPSGPIHRPRRVWECWAFREDIVGLDRWAELTGPGYRGVLVFAYALQASVELPTSTPDLFVSRDRRYLFRAVDVTEYRDHMRGRSPSWDTVNLGKADFRNLVRPFRDFVQPQVIEEVPF